MDKASQTIPASALHGRATEGGVKLTKPQAALLADLPTTCAESYPPARALVSMGLAAWKHGAFGDLLIATTQSGAHEEPHSGDSGTNRETDQ